MLLVALGIWLSIFWYSDMLDASQVFEVVKIAENDIFPRVSSSSDVCL